MKRLGVTCCVLEVIWQGWVTTVRIGSVRPNLRVPALRGNSPNFRTMVRAWIQRRDPLTRCLIRCEDVERDGESLMEERQPRVSPTLHTRRSAF